MYRHTLLAATLYGYETGGKGNVPNILIVIGTLFFHVPLEPEKVFQNVHRFS